MVNVGIGVKYYSLNEKEEILLDFGVYQGEK